MDILEQRVWNHMHYMERLKETCMKKNPTISKNHFLVLEQEIDWGDLQRLVQTNDIKPDTLIFIGRTQEWKKAEDFPSLFPSDWLSCPNCGGKAYGGRSCLLIGMVVLFFPFGLLFLLIKSMYVCSSCGFKFKG